MKKPELPPNKDTKNQLFEVLEISQELMKLQIDPLKMIDSEEYIYWDAFKYKMKNLGIAPEKLWKILKYRRQNSAKYIKISDHKGFLFNYNTLNKFQILLHQFDMNLGGILEGSTLIPQEDKTRYLISSIMEEAIASSQLEGAATTREVAKEMLRTQRSPKDHSERMILNNYLTIKKILEYKDKRLSKELLLEIHSIISKDTLDNIDYEGSFRKTNEVNVVDYITGEVYYIPPEFESLDKIIDDFCNFANQKDENPFIHPIVKAIILHFMIGYIHPFVDGNGRTARAIFYWYLLSKGYWLIEYLSISRIIVQSPAQYARAYLYTEYDENDLTYFIDYNLKTLETSLKELKAYIERKVREKKEVFHLLSKEQFNERQIALLRIFINDEQKIMSIKEAETMMGVVYQTARTDLLGLVEKGYLTYNQSGKKMNFYKSDRFDELVSHTNK